MSLGLAGEWIGNEANLFVYGLVIRCLLRLCIIVLTDGVQALILSDFLNAAIGGIILS